MVRTRESSDRRIVTLRSGQHVHERADEFFAALARQLDRTMSSYPPELLESFESLVIDLHTTMNAYLAEQGDESGT